MRTHIYSGRGAWRGGTQEDQWGGYVGEWGDFHEGDEGKYWQATCVDGASPGDREPYIWVAEGELPPPEDTLTTEELARLARGWLVLPETEFALNPDDRSIVNLPTWVWLPDELPEQLTATASLPNVASVTLTAVPGHMEIEPGTEYARTHPAGGACEGSGQPYSQGATGDPPCGVTYLRSTDHRSDDSYPLTVEVVWTVTWTGTGVGPSGGTLPEGRFAAIRQVPVREIQTIVDGG